MKLTEEQRDRALGILVGQACGDALGVPYEFGAPPADGVPVMKGGGLGDYAPGEWSDDTQMALCIAEVAASGLELTSQEGLDAVATRFEEWLDTNPADIGIQTSRVLRMARGLEGSPSERLRESSRVVHEETGRSAGNGALMRTAVVSVAYLDDPAGAERAARAIAELTHFDPLAGDSCVLWGELIRAAVLTGELSRVDVDVIPVERREYWRGLIDEVYADPTRRFVPNGDTMRALQAALAAVLTGHASQGEPLRDGLVAAVLTGHDTDTVAAIAGGLLGGLYGLSAIPEEWTDAVHGWPGYRVDGLMKLGAAIIDR